MTLAVPAPVNWAQLQSMEVAVWDRIPAHGHCRGESAIAFAAFKTYRDLPAHDRTLVKTAKILGRSTHTLRDHKLRWHWQRRVEAWDDFKNELAKRQQIDAIAEMNKQHLDFALNTFVILGKRLRGVEPDENGEGGVDALDPGDLNANDIARLADIAAKIQRQAAESESVRLGADTLEPPTTVKLAFDVIPSFPSKPQVAPPLVDGTSIRVEADPPPPALEAEWREEDDEREDEPPSLPDG